MCRSFLSNPRAHAKNQTALPAVNDWVHSLLQVAKSIVTALNALTDEEQVCWVASHGAAVVLCSDGETQHAFVHVVFLQGRELLRCATILRCASSTTPHGNHVRCNNDQ